MVSELEDTLNFSPNDFLGHWSWVRNSLIPMFHSRVVLKAGLKIFKEYSRNTTFLAGCIRDAITRHYTKTY